MVRNGVLRQGPDTTYADGDDSTWMDVEWRSLQRPLEIFGRRINVLDTGGSTQPTSSAGTGGPPLLFLHGWSSNWQIFLLNVAAFIGPPLSLPRREERAGRVRVVATGRRPS